MVVLDEAWALIDNAVFAPRIKDWLKVLRKLNAFVIFATQSVEDASKSDISDTLIQQTATQIFLPNLADIIEVIIVGGKDMRKYILVVQKILIFKIFIYKFVQVQLFQLNLFHL